MIIFLIKLVLVAAIGFVISMLAVCAFIMLFTEALDIYGQVKDYVLELFGIKKEQELPADHWRHKIHGCYKP